MILLDYNLVFKLKRVNYILMKIDLEKFVGVYIREAFKIAQKNLEIDRFDEDLRASVSKKTNLTQEQVKYIHHAFHWELICNNNSILEYVQPSKNGENNFIRLKRPYKNKDIKDLKNLILDKYKEYLKARIRSYRE